MIIKDKTKFLTKIYRKTTFTGQYLNYQSFCSKKRKVNLIKTLYHRAYKICSKELLDSEVDNIKNILITNGYPVDLIKMFIKSHLNSLNKFKIFGPEKSNLTALLRLRVAIHLFSSPKLFHVVSSRFADCGFLLLFFCLYFSVIIVSNEQPCF